MVYTVAMDQDRLLPVYELLACLHLTNPDSKIEMIVLLHKKTVLVLDKITIDEPGLQGCRTDRQRRQAPLLHLSGGTIRAVKQPLVKSSNVNL